MPAKRKTTPAKPSTVAEISRQCGISTKSLRSWKAEGTDIFNPRELAQRIEVMRASAAPGSLSEAKLRKVLLECEKLQHAIDREKGLYFPADQSLHLMGILSNSVQSVWKNLGRELPTLLDGIPTSGMQKIIEHHIDETIIPRFAKLLETGVASLKKPTS